jgi:hypothetical protein
MVQTKKDEITLSPTVACKFCGGDGAPLGVPQAMLLLLPSPTEFLAETA